MAGQDKKDELVVILRKKRPAPTTAAPQLSQEANPKPRQRVSGATPEPKNNTSLANPMQSPFNSLTSLPPGSAPAADVPPSLGSAPPSHTLPPTRQRSYSPEVLQLYAALQTRWPHLFAVTAETMRPLAIGIDRDLSPQFPDAAPRRVKQALRLWMARHCVMYWKALMQGGPRYDLTGTPKGEVTPEQQADARQKRTAWFARRAEQRKQHAASAHATAPVVLPEEPSAS